MNRIIIVTLLGCFFATGLLAIPTVSIDEKLSRDDFESKKFFLLQLTEKDLDSYERLVSVIIAEELLGREVDSELKTLKEDCDKFFLRRISFSVKTFLPHKKELEMGLSYLEKKEPFELVPFKMLIATYSTTLKNGEARCADFSGRAEILLKAVRTLQARRKFKDELVLHMPVLDNELVLAAKVKVINRWLLEGVNKDRSKKELDRLYQSNGQNPLVLALNANFHTQMGIWASDDQVKKEYIENAFDYFIAAVKNGYSNINGCPGLYSELVKLQSKEWNILARYYPYPQHLEGYRERAENLLDNVCQAIIFIPEKTFRLKAYKIMSNLYVYWPSQYGEKPMGYGKMIEYQRLSARREPWPKNFDVSR